MGCLIEHNIQPGVCRQKFRATEQNLLFLTVMTGGGKAFWFQNRDKLQAKTSSLSFRNSSKHIYITKNRHLNNDFNIQMLLSSLVLELYINP